MLFYLFPNRLENSRGLIKIDTSKQSCSLRSKKKKHILGDAFLVLGLKLKRGLIEVQWLFTESQGSSLIQIRVRLDHFSAPVLYSYCVYD